MSDFCERIVTCSKVPVIFGMRDDASQALGFDALGFAIERERLFAQIGRQNIRPGELRERLVDVEG